MKFFQVGVELLCDDLLYASGNLWLEWNHQQEKGSKVGSAELFISSNERL